MPVKKISGVLIKIIAGFIIFVGLLLMLFLAFNPFSVLGLIISLIPIGIGVFLFTMGRKLFKS